MGGNICTHLTRQSYLSFDSKRAESEEGRLEVRWLLARVQSHDHHGISKKLKGHLIGLGRETGIRLYPSMLRSLLSKGEM